MIPDRVDPDPGGQRDAASGGTDRHALAASRSPPGSPINRTRYECRVGSLRAERAGFCASEGVAVVDPFYLEFDAGGCSTAAALWLGLLWHGVPAGDRGPRDDGPDADAP